MRKIKILLVDDDLKNSMLLKRFLEAEDYDVTYANNGAVGWELYSSIAPDIVLLDVNMPEFNGFELASKIRLSDRRTVIFFLTDRTEKTDRLTGFRLKANDYIPKPFYPEELVAKIEERFAGVDISSPKIYKLADTVFSFDNATLTFHGETTVLSVRQAEILRMLAESVCNIVDRDTILAHVWGDTSYANSLALNVQITYLRRALRDPGLAITALKKKGYALTVSPES